MRFLMVLIGFFVTNLESAEVFEKELEQKALSNITQLTFSSMGFERAGEAYFSPDGGSIIFQAVPKGEKEYQIYTMDLSVGVPIMVSTGKGACTCGYYKPNGEKIIFASSHESPILKNEKEADVSGKYHWDLTPYMNIYEANPNGSELKRLTNGSAYHAECGYSPDGKEIVFASNKDGSMNLYVMCADGSNVRQITFTKGCYNGGSFFSPDGRKIVFRADRKKPDVLQLYSINADGTDEKMLTDNTAVNWAPYWHPNGEIIAYTTSKHGHRAYEIYLLHVGTKKEYRLTHNASFDGLPSFSQDGKKILWTSKRAENTCHVFMADFSLPEELLKP